MCCKLPSLDKAITSVEMERISSLLASASIALCERDLRDEIDQDGFLQRRNPIPTGSY